MLTAEWVPFGRAATDRLQAAVAQAQDGDGLAPVTVVTPSVSAAIVLRRRLGAGGLAAVSFLSLEQVAELLAARRLAGAARPPIGRELVAAAVRVELAAHQGRLRVVAHHPATEQRLAEVVLDLSMVPEPVRRDLSHLSGSGDLPAEVIGLAESTLERLGGYALPADVFVEATRELADHPAAVDPLGPVIVHLPDHLPRAAVAMVRRLGEVTDVTVLMGTSGGPGADSVGREVLHALGLAPGDPPAPARTAPTQIIGANDVDDEVRTVVRHLMALVDGGVAVHRIGLLHPGDEPYARTIADVLLAAGIPHSAPSTDTLAATVTGRSLLLALDVAAAGMPRDRLIDLVSQAPVLAPDGQPAPAGRWDRLSRAAGVVEGPEQWQARLTRHAEWLRAMAAEPDLEPEHRERRLVDAREAERLAETVQELAGRAARPPGTWPEVVVWAQQLVHHLLGPVARWGSAPDREVDAHEAVLEAISRLEVMGELEPRPEPAVVRRTVGAALDVPAPRRTSAGRGMMVGPLSAAPGLDVDVVAVVGMVEGSLPRPARESPLLPDHLRSRIGLPPSRTHTDRQQRWLHAALAGGAHHRIVSWPRGDQRRGRTQVPSRWLVDLVEAATGDRPRIRDLHHASAEHPVPGLVVSESFAHGIRRRPAPLDDFDATLGHLVQHLESGGTWDDHPLAVDPVLAAGAQLVAGRRAARFTRFDGNLSGHPLTVDASRPLSATSLEAWASCPRRYLLGRVLGLSDQDRPERIERLEATDVGTVAHRVLEVIVTDAVQAGAVPAPGQPWPPEVHARVEELVDAELDELDRRGRVGHARYRDHDRRQLIRRLRAALHHDVSLRDATGARPVEAELAFGVEGEPPLEIDVGNRVLPFRGYIDRVDLAPDAVHVYDYKSGSAGPYSELSEDDPVLRGRKLQLGLYALAAKRRHGVSRATAHYWFIKTTQRLEQKGFELGDRQEEALVDVLRRMTEGIEGGVFPARPGPHQYHLRSFESCAFCDFDRICSPDRADEWELKRDAPELVDYRALAEGPPDGPEGSEGSEVDG